jgi:hypothetical protein
MHVYAHTFAYSLLTKVTTYTRQMSVDMCEQHVSHHVCKHLTTCPLPCVYAPEQHVSHHVYTHVSHHVYMHSNTIITDMFGFDLHHASMTTRTRKIERTLTRGFVWSLSLVSSQLISGRNVSSTCRSLTFIHLYAAVH